jgi:hypothetical protein
MKFTVSLRSKKMISSRHGKYILANVENITPFGIWMYIKDKEYFLNYKDYPYFKNQTIGSILNVRLIHGFHLYWPELDVDLELENLENPEKYPLKDKAAIANGINKRTAKSSSTVKGLKLVTNRKPTKS